MWNQIKIETAEVDIHIFSDKSYLDLLLVLNIDLMF